MRQKIAIKSSVIGISTRIITIVLSLITTRLFLKYLGIEIKGINGLINNILSLLQLAEMGIGTAIIYALYQPIVEDNQEEICSLMALYKKAYNYIGLFVIGIGSIVSLFLNVTILSLIVSSSTVIQNGVPTASLRRYLFPMLPVSS